MLRKCLQKSQFDNLNSFGQVTGTYENAVNFVIKNIENLFQKAQLRVAQSNKMAQDRPTCAPYGGAFLMRV